MNIIDQMRSAAADTDIDLDRLTRVSQVEGGRLRRRRRATVVGAAALVAVVLGFGTSALLVRGAGPDGAGTPDPVYVGDSDSDSDNPSDSPSDSPSAAPSSPAISTSEAGPSRAELDGAACWPIPGEASPAVPTRDAAVYVAGCLTANKPRLDGLTPRAVTLFQERWAASSVVPRTDLARCANDRTMDVGYATVYTDRGEWVALSRSPCGYLTFPSTEPGVTYAVAATFEELGILDELSGACEGYFLGKYDPDPDLCP